MINFIAKHWIPDYRKYQDKRVRQQYGILCGIVGIFLNILLFAGKLFVGGLSHSIAIMADAFNNLSDAGSSLILLFGFRLAGQKPDPEHPFGHGRLEYVAGLIVSMIIMVMAVELMRSSGQKILHPEEVIWHTGTLVMLVVSILVKLYMFTYNRSYGKKIASAARADCEEFLGCRVNLQCWVKVKSDWRDNEFLLNNFGFKQNSSNR